MNNKKTIYISLLVIIGVIILLNILSEKLYLRGDFTADQQYTLSDATLNIIKDLDEPVTITAYFSDNLPPDVAKTKRDFEDMLIEYNSRSKGMIAYNFQDPNNDKEVEMQAAKAGIQPVMINMREKDQTKQQKAYMAAVIQYQDKKEILPFIQPGAAMEYDLSSNIKKMLVSNKAKIGIMQGYGCPSLDNMHAAVNALSVLYDVQPLRFDDSTYTLKQYKTIAIVAPKDSINPVVFKQLDRYLSEGGNLFIAYNHIVPELRNNPPMGKSISTGLETWLANKGLTIENNLVIDEKCGAVSVQQPNFPFPVQVSFPYLPIITHFADHPVTKGLENVVMQFVSSLTFTGDSTVNFIPLAMTSDKAGTEPAPVYFNVGKKWSDVDFPMQKVPVMGLLYGKIVGNTQSKMIVAGDGDFPISKAQRGAEMSDNVSLMTNSIDFLSDDTGLIGLRTKGVSSRPLDTLEDSTKAVLKWLNFLLPLILVVFYGIIRSNMKRSKRNKRREAGYVK